MSKRVSMLDAMYTHLDNITVANGYNYNWVELKSIGNGSYATQTDTCNANFSFGLEIASESKGQSLYYMDAPLYIKGYYKYSQNNLKENDYNAEVVKSKMIEDLRKAYGLETIAMCQAGVNSLGYSEEIEPEDVSGDTVAIQLQFRLRWYDERI